ncbi:MAG: M20/M25/M40 family metallo-hydrolase [Kangiellaceae bacterium]
MKTMLKIHLIISLLLISFQLVKAKDMELIADNEFKKIEALRDKALTSPLAYEILESLTTEVGARMAGTPQDTLAVKWAEKKFKSLGFDKVWKEPVTFPTWKRGVETAAITTPYQHQLHITALGGSIGTPKNGMTGEVIQFPDLDTLKKASKKQVKGKIVFISNRMQRFKNGRGYGSAVAARSQGAVEASKKGAIAIVIRSIGTDSHRLPHTGMMRYDDAVKKIPAAALSNPDADQLERIFKRGHKPSIKLNIGAHQDSEFTSYNVIGEIKGTSRSDEVIVIGGHLDSWDLGTGAVDDGAGVAITMAAAALIKQSKFRLKRSIRVILWANEEQGLIGAKAYAEQHKKDLDQHIVGAESDFGAGKIYQFSTLFNEQDKPFIDQLKNIFRPLGIQYYNNKARPGPDLIPLHQNGMSVFNLYQDGNDYFDLHHTADDTLDKVDPAALAQNVAAYTAFSLMMAQYEGDLKRPVKDK